MKCLYMLMHLYEYKHSRILFKQVNTVKFVADAKHEMK